MLIQDEVTNQLVDKSDKATFLNELGLEECDEDNDKEDRWEDCMDGEYEGHNQDFEIAGEVHMIHLKLFCIMICI